APTPLVRAAQSAGAVPERQAAPTGRADFRGRRWRSDSPALLERMARRETRCAHFVRYAQTVAASQMSMRAGARGHAFCAARRSTRRVRRVPPAALATP